MKPFSQWTKEEVEEEFGLYADRNYALLQEWVAVPPSLTDEEQRTLDRLSQKLLTHVHEWNEEELKIYFIAFIIDFADFWQPNYRPFLERELSVEYAEGKRLWELLIFSLVTKLQLCNALSREAPDDVKLEALPSRYVPDLEPGNEEFQKIKTLRGFKTLRVYLYRSYAVENLCS